MKTCRRCGETRPMEEFHNDNRAKDKHRSKCKDCETIIRTQWRSDNPIRDRDTLRRSELSRRYGLSLEAWEAMRVAQHNACATCKEPFTATPHTDHCHTTGQVRALLCSSCNTAIGLMKEDPARLRAAASYIELHASAYTESKYDG